jgi:hypothetical protein
VTIARGLLAKSITSQNESGERDSFAASGVFIPGAVIPENRDTLLSSFFQLNKRAHSTSLRQQLGLFAFVSGRCITSSDFRKSGLTLSAACDFTLSFGTSHESPSPDLLETRGQVEAT